MMHIKLYIVDKRILQLAEILKEQDKISFAKDLFDSVKISKQTVTNVRTRGAHFTVKQIEKICKKTGADVNWIFGLQDENPFRK